MIQYLETHWLLRTTCGLFFVITFPIWLPIGIIVLIIDLAGWDFVRFLKIFKRV